MLYSLLTVKWFHTQNDFWCFKTKNKLNQNDNSKWLFKMIKEVALKIKTKWFVGNDAVIAQEFVSKPIILLVVQHWELRLYLSSEKWSGESKQPTQSVWQLSDRKTLLNNWLVSKSTPIALAVERIRELRARQGDFWRCCKPGKCSGTKILLTLAFSEWKTDNDKPLKRNTVVTCEITVYMCNEWTRCVTQRNFRRMCISNISNKLKNKSKWFLKWLFKMIFGV